MTEPDGVEATVRRLVRRADDIAKAAPGSADPTAVRDRARVVLDDARERLVDAPHLDAELVRALSVQVTRRMLDLDGADLATDAEPPPGMSRAPTRDVDPSRVPPGQHLTPGFPVLHVAAGPSDPDPADWTVTVAGHVHDRVRLSLDDLVADAVEVTADFHCVTTWSRLDTTWVGVPVARLVERARPRDTAAHALVYGHPAYSANLALDDLLRPDVLLAWEVEGQPLPTAHGGPLRLVVPHLYGWKSVKWVTEVRLVDREVPGYWEERGYHLRGDPWREERFADMT